MIQGEDFWNLIEHKLLEWKMSFGELSIKILKNGNDGQIYDKRAKNLYPSIKTLKRLSFLFTDDELYLICRGNEKSGYDNYALTLHPSKELIQKQRLRRKLQRAISFL